MLPRKARSFTRKARPVPCPARRAPRRTLPAPRPSHPVPRKARHRNRKARPVPAPYKKRNRIHPTGSRLRQAGDRKGRTRDRIRRSRDPMAVKASGTPPQDQRKGRQPLNLFPGVGVLLTGVFTPMMTPSFSNLLRREVTSPERPSTFLVWETFCVFTPSPFLLRPLS